MSIIRNYHSLNRNTQLAALSLLAKEFYSPENFEKGVSAFASSIENNNEQILCLLINNTVVGVTSYRIFDWARISPQLYIQAKFKNNQLNKIRLQHLSDLLMQYNLKHNYSHAVELAYSVIDKAHRGQGYGRVLYLERLREISQLSEPNKKVIFTIARSDFAGTDLRKKLLDVLLQHEKIAYGQYEDGQAIVKGAWVDAGKVGSILNVNIESLTPFDGPKAIIHQVQKYGLCFVGYYTNLSPVYAEYLPEIISKFRE